MTTSGPTAAWSSACPARSRPTSTGWPSPPTGCARSASTASSVLIEAGAGADSSFPDDDYRRAGAEIVADADEVWERAGADLQGQGAPGQRVRLLPRRPRPSSPTCTWPPTRTWPTPCWRAGTTGIAYETVTARRRQPAPAGPHERGGRTHVHPDRGPLPGAPQRRTGRAAGRRPGRPPGPGGGAGRRQRGLERGVDGGRPGGRDRPARPQRRPAALHRPDPDGPHHHAHLQPGPGGAGGGRGRPGHRRRAGGRRAGAGGRHRGHGAGP